MLRKSNLYIILCLITVTFFLIEAKAQQEEDKTITLQQGQVYMPDNADVWLDNFRRSPAPTQVLVRFKQMPATAERQQWAAAGLNITDYLGGTVFAALIHPNLQVQSSIFSNLSSIVDMEPHWKLDHLLDTAIQQKVIVLVNWFQNTPDDSLNSWFSEAKATIKEHRYRHLNAAVLEIPSQKLSSLAAHYGIRSISQSLPDQALNFESASSSQINLARTPVNYGGLGLDGSGVTVGVGDNYSGIDHVDLYDRIVNFHPWAYHNHGVHINGIVGGAGIMDPKGMGMAPRVRLLDHAYTMVWAQTSEMRARYNMTITNNSYASRLGKCEVYGVYDAYSVVLDELSREEPEVLHVFAAGNQGKEQCGAFPAGYGTVAGAYQAAKNVLVVANNTKAYENFEESSRGPTQDGRIKPEISAVGTEVYSTIRGDIYLSSGGTSMASPAVAGGLALLTQRYKQLHGGVNPRGDLLKALILNGAVDHGRPGPDYAFGFGVMNLDRALKILEGKQYQRGAVEHGKMVNFELEVPADAVELKVLLYWHDTAGSPAATKTLVNDLDIELIDPSGKRHLPLVLHSTPSMVQQTATPGVDRVNNVEQVVVNRPASGKYVVRISGHNIPFGPQDFVVAWHIMPREIKITYPSRGSAWPTDQAMHIYWDAFPDRTNFKLEFSADNGQGWTTIADDIPSDIRHVAWTPHAINAAQCRIRITRKGTNFQHTSAPFVLHQEANLRLDDNQCPGYISIKWDSVGNSTGYEVMMKRGSEMVPVDTVTGTRYVLKGLFLDSQYYVAVRPIIQGVAGWRSKAVRRRPDKGDCMGSISDGDLMLERVISPTTARANTTSGLTNNMPLTVLVRNLDDVLVQEYEVSYQINNASWQLEQINRPLAANSNTPLTVGMLDLGDTGTYNIKLAIRNLSRTDPVAKNDSIFLVVRHIPNEPVNIDNGYLEDFESAMWQAVLGHRMGMGHDERWDFSSSTDSGRIRFDITDSITINGVGSASLDAQTNLAGNNNLLEATFNLSNYTKAEDEVRLEFDYRLHGTPKFPEGNCVWARGSDTGSWLKLYTYDTLADAGAVLNSGSLSLSEVFEKSLHEFTSAVQIRFGQYDTGVIASADYGNGLTIDDVRLYTVTNDMELLSIVSPVDNGCHFGKAENLQVLVRNRHPHPQYNIQLSYRVDSGTVYSATLPEIGGRDSLIFTFPQTVDLSQLGVYHIDVWLEAAGDSYQKNDSLMGQMIRHLPFIDSFPYLEKFEQGGGHWYTGGTSSSWQYGIPNSFKINKAASGAHVWMTNLEGDYNNMEHSYLYSPCFDLSRLSEPMLSFSMSLDLEECPDQPCDRLWLEYSVDGGEWQKLGRKGQGTNWYNQDETEVWSEEGFTRWHVASIALPKANNLRLRFVLDTDPAVSGDGVAIDDIHIFDRLRAIYSGGTTGLISQQMESGRWNEVLADGQRVWNIHLGGRLSGRYGFEVFEQPQIFDPVSWQYYFPKSYLITAGSDGGSGQVSMQLFITEQDFLRMIQDSSCLDCSRPEDVYRIGVSRYTDPDTRKENGLISDNIVGAWQYIPWTEISWVPYDDGYYASFAADGFSEYWLNDGGPLAKYALGSNPIDLRADKINITQAAVTWDSEVDKDVVLYELERSYDSLNFEVLTTIDPAYFNWPGSYKYIDEPRVDDWAPVFYKLRYHLKDGREYMTPVRRLDWSVPDFLATIFPNPSQNGHFAIVWSSAPGSGMDLTIEDISGRQIYRNRFEASGWNNISMIQLDAPRSGVYMVRAKIGPNLFSRKLVIY